MLFAFCFSMLWLPVRILYPTKVIGKENIKKVEGAVLTCNHYSNMDPIILDIYLNKKIMFLGKQELFKNKLFAYCLKRFGGYPVNRDKPELSSIKFALNCLKDNKFLGVFPEGTRNKDLGENELLQLKNGAIMFASKSDKSIIPMIIYKRPRIFRRNYIVVGEEIKIEGENSKKLTPEEVESNTKRLVGALKDLRTSLDLKFERKRKNKLVK